MGFVWGECKLGSSHPLLECSRVVMLDVHSLAELYQDRLARAQHSFLRSIADLSLRQACSFLVAPEVLHAQRGQSKPVLTTMKLSVQPPEGLAC